MIFNHGVEKRVALCLLLLLCSVAMIGCENPLDYIANKLTGESAKWRELAQVQAQGAIRAIPGERYLQIIDDLNGTDEKKRTEAQQFLTRLGNLDKNATIAWTGTALFSYDEKNKMHADAFWGFSDSRAQVEYFVQNAYSGKHEVASTGYRDYTMDELNGQIDSGVDALLNQLQGNPTPQSMATGQQFMGNNVTLNYLTWDNSLTPGTPFGPVPLNPNLSTKQQVLDRAKGVKDAAAASLKQLLKAQYAKKEIPVGSTTLSILWHPEEAKNLFFILIPEDDWEKHKNDAHLSIEVKLHKQGEPDTTYQNTFSFPVNLNQFNAPQGREPVDLRFGGGRVRWAVVDPTHSSASLPDLAPDKIQNMKHLLELVNQINAGTASVGAPQRNKAHAVAWIMFVITVLLLGIIAFLLFKLQSKTRRRA
jgi:hypothetical protein